MKKFHSYLIQNYKKNVLANKDDFFYNSNGILIESLKMKHNIHLLNFFKLLNYFKKWNGLKDIVYTCNCYTYIYI